MRPPLTTTPRWLSFVESGVDAPLDRLNNKHSDALLFITVDDRIFVFAFGFGRALLSDDACEADFGLRTAINSIDADSLHSIDTFTLEEYALQKRAQSSKAARLDVFGLDVSRDILRAVTGKPFANLPFTGVAGSAYTLALSAKLAFHELGDLCRQLLALYHDDKYKKNFKWIDNIRTVNDRVVIASLEDLLVHDLTSPSPRAYLAPPELVESIRLDGYRYTGMKADLDSALDLGHYLALRQATPIDISQLRKDRVHVYMDGSDTASSSWMLYRCLVFEAELADHRYILSDNRWFQVRSDFVAEVREEATAIEIGGPTLLPIGHRPDGRIEIEGDYCKRVAAASGLFLMDRKNAKCRAASSPIELCDLLSLQGDLVCIKKRDQGSSGLSHLFAQGRVAAEALIRDGGFREEIRKIIQRDDNSFLGVIPVAKPDASKYRVVFAILGGDLEQPATDLPFFSQLNLVRSAQFLGLVGFQVSIQAISIDSPGPELSSTASGHTSAGY